MTSMLVVGGDAEPSAPSNHLLELLRWVRHHHPDVEARVLLLRGGPLVHRFQDVVPTTLVDWSAQPGEPPWVGADVTLISGREALDAEPAIAGPEVGGVVHLPDAAGGPPGELGRWRRRLNQACAVLVDSDAARRTLVSEGVTPALIEVHPRMTPMPAPAAPGAGRRRRGPVVVGGWGGSGWAGGADLFIRVVAAVRRAAGDVDVAFEWGGCDRPAFEAVERMAASAGLDGAVTFAEELDVSAWVSTIDVLVATERRVETSVADLAAAAAGVPYVAFQGPGRVAGAGRLVSYPDADAVAHEVQLLCRSPELRDTVGRNGSDRVRDGHAVDQVAPGIWDVIRRCATG